MNPGSQGQLVMTSWEQWISATHYWMSGWCQERRWNQHIRHESSAEAAEDHCHHQLSFVEHQMNLVNSLDWFEEDLLKRNNDDDKTFG